MIKKLRNKFVIVTMLLLAIVFTAIFGGYYSYTTYWNRSSMVGFLEWIAESDSFQETIAESGFSGNGIRPIFAVTADSSGKVTDIKSSSGHSNSEKVQKIVDGILSKGEDHNKWRAYLYCIADMGEGSYYIVYTDYSMDAYEVRELIAGIAMLIGTLLAFLCVSVFLSRFVTRPAEEMMRREKRFISDASHELKTPVAAIRVNAQVLAAQEKDNKLVNNILSETERMSSLIQELLTFSYLEEKGREIQKEKFSLSDACEEIALALESTAFEKHIDFGYEIQPGIDYVGNCEEIKRAVSVLLDNAIQHTPQGGEVSVNVHTESGKSVITVYNTGEGISPENLPHIFERFYRIENERGGENGNFGLGLSIAKTIVENHNGTINVKSEPGEYVKFEVRL